MKNSVKKLKKLSFKKIVLLIVAFFFLSVGIGLIWASFIRLPDISTFEARKIANSSKITDRTGEIILYDINQGVRRTEIPFDQMGENIKNAVVSIEDAHFYTHKGIRPTSIIRAIFVNVFSGSFSQGGSTLTQQIIKNTLLNQDKTIVRKFKEWVLALKLERKFTKEQILQIYLNDAPFGGTIYGVEEAARAFYGISSKDLSVAQSAYLAALMPAPTYYSPFGNNKDKLDQRKNLVLSKMKQHGYISEEIYQQAINEEVVFSTNASNSIKAPHFTFFILDYLEQKYGKDVMESGGYMIRTTLDYTLQQNAEKIITESVEENLRNFNASNSALVAIDPTTGHILSMVGSKDYFAKDIDGAYNVATAKRQPGSAFKPFVYAAAFAKGYTPETILFDVSTEFSTSCATAPDTCYRPGNFDDKFKGPISLRSALAESRNIPSVKLLYLVGLDDALLTAKNLGISTLGTKENYGLSLVLGGGEVTLLDMTSAFGVFANSGVRNQATGILEIKDRKGKIIEEYQTDPIEVMDKNAVLTLNDVLSDEVARRPTFGNSITIPGVAVKTGTTNDQRDAWIMGYTPSIVVGIWSGNNDNRSMRSGGGAVSGPILKKFMEDLLSKYPAPLFEKPAPAANYEELKPILRGVWRVDENNRDSSFVSVHSILHWVDKDNPLGNIPSNPARDPQYRLWEPSVQSWWLNNMANYGVVNTGNNPTVDIEGSPDISILGLPNQMEKDGDTVVFIKNDDSNDLVSADIFVNNNFITSLSSPFQFTFKPSQYGYQEGNYVMKVIGTNNLNLKNTDEKSFRII